MLNRPCHRAVVLFLYYRCMQDSPYNGLSGDAPPERGTVFQAAGIEQGWEFVISCGIQGVAFFQGIRKGLLF